MSDAPAAAVLEDDGSPPIDSAREDRNRVRPPVPSSRPVTKLNTKAVAKSEVPVENLINMDEGESTTGAGNGLPTESAGSSQESQKGEECLSPTEIAIHAFLDGEKDRPYSDYGNKYSEVRNEQERLFKDSNYKTLIANAAPHCNRNRYRDILPYDHNRVPLRDQTDNLHGYMNASFIRFPDYEKVFIAAQAPLQATLEEWWKMIDEQKVTLIVMLCKLVEMSKVKCERYYPTEIGHTEVYGDYEIKLEEEQKFPEDDEYILRMMSMTNMKTAEVRNIWQLHYREWPDHGCPKGEKQLLNMLDVMETLYLEHSEGKPILVHCSAGVGRTGTIIAINYVRELIKTETLKLIDVFSLVCRLRTQRSSMVQTQDQYYFVHKCIAAYCRRHLGLPEPEVDMSWMETPLTGGGVRLIPPPTPTTSGQPGIAQQSQPDPIPTGSGQVVEDESDATSVPDFPEEPPAPQGPEDLGNSAAS